MKMPQAWTEVKAKTNVGNQVRAKIDMSADVVGRGLCPECRQPMTEVHAEGHRLWACVRDRVALPMPNPEPSDENQTQVQS